MSAAAVDAHVGSDSVGNTSTASNETLDETLDETLGGHQCPRGTMHTASVVKECARHVAAEAPRILSKGVERGGAALLRRLARDRPSSPGSSLVVSLVETHGSRATHSSIGAHVRFERRLEHS